MCGTHVIFFQVFTEYIRSGIWVAGHSSELLAESIIFVNFILSDW